MRRPSITSTTQNDQTKANKVMEFFLGGIKSRFIENMREDEFKTKFYVVKD